MGLVAGITVDPGFPAKETLSTSTAIEHIRRITSLAGNTAAGRTVCPLFLALETASGVIESVVCETDGALRRVAGIAVGPNIPTEKAVSASSRVENVRG